MGADYKSVRLTVDAYEALERRKREDETFSEAVERLASERPIRDLAGVFTDDEVDEIRSARKRAYDRYATRRDRVDDA
ncbi:antitoxin VapB family protein [Natrialbaceae archaeon GCM10025810]|uniref:antitoxin VapB family protein n=1 Tax=Halovalidus salilacus TaxID=3075124 RepID=UPI00360C8EEE